MPHRPSRLSKFWQELKRRKVVYIITVYASVSFVIIELINNVVEPLHLPERLSGIVIIALVIAFPIIITLSWIFDISPKGVEKTKSVKEHGEGKEVITSNSWRIATYASIVVIIGLIVFNIISRNNIEHKLDLYGKSIAVLPFINNSADTENAYFVNATMEAILNNLGKIKDLRVISRTSVEAYRENPKAIPTIAEEMKVSYVLEGSAQKYGNSIRLTVTLIDANDRNLWSKLFNREIEQIEDLLSLQSEIAQLVADEIKVVITPEEKQLIEKVSTRSLTAYDFYQRGHEEYNAYQSKGRDRVLLDKAEEFYHLAINNDPSFAKAYSGLARVYWEKQYWTEYFSENFMDSVLILADMALTYDNTLAEAYNIKGQYYEHIGNIPQAIREFDKAIEFNPNDWVAFQRKGYVVKDYVKKIENMHNAVIRCRDSKLGYLLVNLSNWYLHMGFTDEAMHYLQESFTLMRDSASYYCGLAYYEYVLGNYKTAVEYLDRGIALDSVYLFLAEQEFYINAGQYDKAYATYQRLIERSKASGVLFLDNYHRIAYASWKTGHLEEAEYYFDQQIMYCNESIKLNRPNATEGFAYYNLAAVYAFKGDKDKAYRYLDEAEKKLAVEFWMITSMMNDRLFESFRGEERYQRFLHNMELEYQTEHERIRKGLEELDLLVSTLVY